MGQFISSSERSRGPQSTCVKSNEPLPYSDGLPKHIPAKSQGHSWQNTNVHRGGGHISAPSQGWYARRSGRLTTHLYCCINLGLPATLDATTRHQTRGAISLQRSRVDRTCFSFWCVGGSPCVKRTSQGFPLRLAEAASCSGHCAMDILSLLYSYLY